MIIVYLSVTLEAQKAADDKNIFLYIHYYVFKNSRAMNF